MKSRHIRWLEPPEIRRCRMVVGFDGWMDGGNVSTGTLDGFIHALAARPVAEIDSSPFYIFSFPGTMEVASLFRPHTRIVDGRVEELEFPTNQFHYDPANELVLFRGKEPNLRWEEFADSFFEVAESAEVERIYFVGSVAGAVPHTREPRFYCTVSEEHLRQQLQQYVVRFSEYEGPASLVTYLLREAPKRGMEMVSIIAEIPAYVQGPNPDCIESVTRRIAGMLGIQVDLSALRAAGQVFERKLTEVVQEREELRELIQKLESDYDSEVFDTQMGDLKQWLENQGIRLD